MESESLVSFGMRVMSCDRIVPLSMDLLIVIVYMVVISLRISLVMIKMNSIELTVDVAHALADCFSNFQSGVPSTTTSPGSETRCKFRMFSLSSSCSKQV